MDLGLIFLHWLCRFWGYVRQIGAEFQFWIQYHTCTYNATVGASIEPSMKSTSHWRCFCQAFSNGHEGLGRVVLNAARVAQSGNLGIDG